MTYPSITTTELRCAHCGEFWTEDGPICCGDPVDQYMTVRRIFRPEYGRTLAEVSNPQGEVIAASYEESTS